MLVGLEPVIKTETGAINNTAGKTPNNRVTLYMISKLKTEHFHPVAKALNI
jgi:hypothetical protein